MSTELETLAAVVSAMQTEMETLRGELRAIQRVVQISDHPHGTRSVKIECQHLNIRPAETPGQMAVSIGYDEHGGDLRIFGLAAPDSMHTAMRLQVQRGNVPQLELKGPKKGMRVVLQVNEDASMVAALGNPKGGVAYLKGHATGAAVALSDGKLVTQAGLIYYAPQPQGDGMREAGSEMLLNDGSGQSVLSMHGSEKEAWLKMGPPGESNVFLFGNKEATGLNLESPNHEHHVIVAASKEAAELQLYRQLPETNDEPGTAGMRLAVHSLGTSISHTRPDGEPSIVLAHQNETGLSSLDFLEKNGEAGLGLRQRDDGLKRLFVGSQEKKPAFGVGVTPEVTVFEVCSPTDPGTHFGTYLGTAAPMVALYKNDQIAIALTANDGVGSVNAYGTLEGQTGYATLSGGSLSGTVSLSTPDGTALMTLSNNQHGGHISINNDLGFSRIAMGVYQESAAIFLNHTGTKGVDIVAGEKGGVVAAFDPEGELAATLPESWDDEEE